MKPIGDDTLFVIGYVSFIILVVWGIWVKLLMRENERSEYIRQKVLLLKPQERKKLPKPVRALLPSQQDQIPARVKVALIMEKNDGKPKSKQA
jgi:hypothetical protein